MLFDEFETRAQIVVVLPVLPAARAVAGLATRAEALFVDIVFLMA